MIEQALYEHLKEDEALAAFLTTYADEPAIFNQEAPADIDPLWKDGPQYGRIVYAVDLQGDPERTMGGMLAVDIQCKENLQFPEEIEPVVRELIHGWFFSNGTFTVEAQWKDSSYFTEPTDNVTGCTVTFDLLGFPIMSTGTPDLVQRFNEWSATIDGVHVINYDELPATAWKPDSTDSAIYWRVVVDNPAGWIPDTFQTTWRSATMKCHIFSADHTIADTLARNIIQMIYARKRLLKEGETPIMVNRNNSLEFGADPLRTGQVTIEATYALVVYEAPDPSLEHFNLEIERKENT